jgi:hypothetical protein
MFPAATEFDINYLLKSNIWPEDQSVLPTFLTLDSAKKLIERISELNLAINNSAKD